MDEIAPILILYLSECFIGIIRINTEYDECGNPYFLPVHPLPVCKPSFQRNDFVGGFFASAIMEIWEQDSFFDDDPVTG